MGASGTTTIDFGAFPGATDATVDVTGQAGYVAASEVEAWIQPIATADHSVDEHVLEKIDVTAYYKADGEFTIRGVMRDGVVEVPLGWIAGGNRAGKAGGVARLVGQFTVGWAWN